MTDQQQSVILSMPVVVAPKQQGEKSVLKGLRLPTLTQPPVQMKVMLSNNIMR